MDQAKDSDEANRLERLWANDFGNEYVARNQDAGKNRDDFWTKFVNEFRVGNLLEVGCNIGANLQWLVNLIAPNCLHGIDINTAALGALHRRFPRINLSRAAARSLPYPDSSFNLTFTAGVLIHQPECSLGQVMSEIVRCSNRYLLCMEYYAPQTEEIPYRNQTGALFKRDYGQRYLSECDSIRLLRKGFLARSEGWDDLTYWIFEKRESKKRSHRST